VNQTPAIVLLVVVVVYSALIWYVNREMRYRGRPGVLRLGVAVMLLPFPLSGLGVLGLFMRWRDYAQHPPFDRG